MSTVRVRRGIGGVVAGMTALAVALTTVVTGAGPAAAAPGAVLPLDGCTSTVLERNDDQSSGVVQLPFDLNFYGVGYNQLFVNNNGNVTFDGPLSSYTPWGLVGNFQPIIAPFFADVDTRGGAGEVTYGMTTFEGHETFCVSWPEVGYYPNQVDKLNTFQLLLVHREDRGNSDFDIVFNYDSVQWETGSASGGSGGFGGESAHAGFSSGAGTADTSYEIEGSGVHGALLDDSPTGLANTSRGSSVPGRWTFTIRNGSPNYVLRSPDELFGVRSGSFYVSDPVNTATGNLVAPITDLDSVGGRTGFGLSRTYNSRDDAVGSFGAGWSSVLDVAATEVAAGGVELRDSDGRIVPFASTGTGWTRPEEFPGSLLQQDDGRYSVAFDDGTVWAFDSQGALRAIYGADGESSTFIRGDSGLVDSVEHSSGPSLTLERDGNGQVVRAAASDGREVRYEYTGTNDPGVPTATREAGEPAARVAARPVLATVTDPSEGVRQYEYDQNGRLLSETAPDGRVLMTNTYDRSGRVLSQTTIGDEVTFAYDDLEGTTTVVDARTGETTLVRHDSQGHPVAVVDSTGQTATRTYDATGNLVATTDRSSATTQATYDDAGRLLSSTDALGATTTWEYDDLGRLSATTDAGGARTTYEYEGDERTPSVTTTADGAVTRTDVQDERVLSITDPDGVSQTFEYDAQGNITATIDGLGGRAEYERDGAGRIVRETTAAGREHTYEYDALGRTVAATDAAGTTRTTFDAVGRVLTSTDPTGAVTTYTYDDDGNLSTVTDPLGDVVTTTYDDAGRIASTTGARGDVTTYTYGPLGRLESIIDPTGGVTRYTYDARGQVATVTDPLGNTTSQTVDPLGRVTASTDPAGGTTTYTYDAAGNVTTSTGPTGATTSTEYDDLGRATTVTDATGAISSTTWTPGGRVASTTDATGVTETFGYDAAGRHVSTTDALGGVTRIEYDADGLVLTETTPAGRAVHYEYDDAARLVATRDEHGTTRRELDAVGRVTATVAATGGRTAYAYDAAGNLVSATDPLGATTTWVWQSGTMTDVTDATGATEHRDYDLAGRVTSVVDRSGHATTYAYDAAGHLTSVTDPTGRSRTTTYDPAGRITATGYGDGSSTVSEWDAAGNRTSMTDSRGTTTYERDALGRLTATTAPDGAVQRWTYDAAGRPVQTTAADGAVTTATYDAAGRLTSQSRAGWGTASWQLDADGLVVREDLPGGQYRTYTYDGAGSLATWKQRVGLTSSGVTLGRDADGRITSTKTVGGLSTGSATYRYDAAGQLTAASVRDLDLLTPAQQTWTYDPVGNRTTSTADGVRSDYSYDAGHQLTAVTTRGVRTSYTYDEAGRRTGEATLNTATTYTYDAAGQLTTTQSRNPLWTTTQTRRYDGDGTLVGYDVTRGRQTASTELDWDPTSGVPQLQSTTTAGHTTGYVTARGNALGVTRANGSSAVLAQDVFGSIVLTLATADVTKAGSYDPFGEPALNVSLSDLTLTPTLGYRGSLQLSDDAYLHARTYDPDTGQFLSTDPVEQPAGTATGTNEYAYVANDPLNLVDPLGLSPVSDSGVNGFDLVSAVAAASPSTPDISEWSAQHTAVQRNFIATKRPTARMEVAIPGSGPNGGIGRADLVDGHEIWEVKTASWHANLAKRQDAVDQLMSYVSGMTGAEPGAPYGQYAFTYGSGQLVVNSHLMRGMLWYYYRSGPGRTPQPVPAPQPYPVPVPVPVPNPAPAPSRSWQPPAFPGRDVVVPVLGMAAGGALMIGGGALIVGTIAEDFVTVGVGVLDDPLTIGGGLAAIGSGWALYQSSLQQWLRR